MMKSSSAAEGAPEVDSGDGPEVEVRQDYDRLPVRVEAMICVDDTPMLFSTTRNVSRHGVFVEAAQPLPVGEEIQIFLQEPRLGQVFRFNATVAHAEDGIGFGAQFYTRSAQAQIDRFVASLGEEQTALLPNRAP
jgi:hypothetical protein